MVGRFSGSSCCFFLGRLVLAGIARGASAPRRVFPRYPAWRLRGQRPAVAGPTCIGVAGIFVPIEAYLAGQQRHGAPIAASLTAEGGWAPSEATISGWRPHYRGFAWAMMREFRKEDRNIGVFIAYYRDQQRGRELVTSANQLTAMEALAWRPVARSSQSIEWSGERVTAERVQVAGPEIELDALRLFWIDGRVTASEYVAKALIAWSRLAGRGDDAAVIVLYGQAQGGAGWNGRSRILRSHVASIGHALDHVQQIDDQCANAPLINHVVFRLAVGGLENGVVNWSIAAIVVAARFFGLTDIDVGLLHVSTATTSSLRYTRVRTRVVAAPGFRAVARMEAGHRAYAQSRGAGDGGARVAGRRAARIHGEMGATSGLDGSRVRYQLSGAPLTLRDRLRRRIAGPRRHCANASGAGLAGPADLQRRR
jgi:EpsI family protein